MSVSGGAQYTVYASRSQWAKLQPKSEYAFCAMPSAKTGDVWAESYPLLDNQNRQRRHAWPLALDALWTFGPYFLHQSR